MSPSARAPHAAPWVDLVSGGRAGKDREIFKKYLKSTGHEASPALLLTELLSSFSVIYWLPKV